MSTKYTKLAKNTVIFTIGNFATKILSFLIVPLYTYILSTEEYGRIDLFFTAGSLIVSFLTLQIHQAMMRFLLGKETKDEIALSNCMAVFILETVLSLLFLPIYILAFKSTELGLLFLVNLVFSSFNVIFSDYLLVVEKNVLYAIKGVVVTAVLLSSNVIALVFLKLGMNGYIYANILSQIVGCVFLLLTNKYQDKIKIKNIDFDILKQMLKYCVPLIPNSLMWWIMSSGDKFIINYYLGDSANGLYSLALKVPTIISMFYSYFVQAWAISAIEENESEERKQFYERIYKVSNAMLFAMVSIITLFIKLLYTTVMGVDYRPSWIYVPILAMATAFSSQTSFFAVFYTLSKKTKSIFVTTLAGTVINLIANFILVHIIGLQGIALGTAIGYIVVLIIRMSGTRKDMKIDLDTRRTLICLGIIILQITVTITCGDVFLYGIGVIASGLIMYLYRSELISLIADIITKIRIKKANAN